MMIYKRNKSVLRAIILGCSINTLTIFALNADELLDLCRQTISLPGNYNPESGPRVCGCVDEKLSDADDRNEVITDWKNGDNIHNEEAIVIMQKCIDIVLA